MNPKLQTADPEGASASVAGPLVPRVASEQQQSSFLVQPPRSSSDVQRMMQQGIENGASSQEIMQWL